jgi:hypothetical protein
MPGVNQVKKRPPGVKIEKTYWETYANAKNDPDSFRDPFVSFMLKSR